MKKSKTNSRKFSENNEPDNYKHILKTKIKSGVNYDELIQYFNHLSSPFSIFDNKKKKFIYCNEKFIKLTGLSLDECYDFEFKDFENWIHPDDNNIIQDNIGNRLKELYKNNANTISLSTQKINFQFNFRLKENDNAGNPIFLLAQCTVIKWDELNQPEIVLTLLSNITGYNYYSKIVFSIEFYNTTNHQWITIFQEEFLAKPQMLSDRELEVLKHIIQDMTALEISKTFKNYISHGPHALEKHSFKDRMQVEERVEDSGEG